MFDIREYYVLGLKLQKNKSERAFASTSDGAVTSDNAAARRGFMYHWLYYASPPSPRRTREYKVPHRP